MKTLLKNIITTPTLLARFLNTLSLLEYVGARKILKSQKYDQIDEQMLAHAAEEIRHAQVVKRAALKLAPELCNDYSEAALLCGKEAHDYFQTLDQAVNEVVQANPKHAYLFTTYLIEIRAVEFYNLFDTALNEADKPAIFRGILVEEERHLAEILAALKTFDYADSKIEQLTYIEQQAFAKFMAAVQQHTTLA